MAFLSIIQNPIIPEILLLCTAVLGFIQKNRWIMAFFILTACFVKVAPHLKSWEMGVLLLCILLMYSHIRNLKRLRSRDDKISRTTYIILHDIGTALGLDFFIQCIKNSQYAPFYKFYFCNDVPLFPYTASIEIPILLFSFMLWLSDRDLFRASPLTWKNTRFTLACSLGACLLFYAFPPATRTLGFVFNWPGANNTLVSFLMICLPTLGAEILFRGFVQGKLKKFLLPKVPVPYIHIILTSLLFSWRAFSFPTYLLSGLVYGYIYDKTNNIFYSTIAHVIVIMFSFFFPTNFGLYFFYFL